MYITETRALHCMSHCSPLFFWLFVVYDLSAQLLELNRYNNSLWLLSNNGASSHTWIFVFPCSENERTKYGLLPQRTARIVSNF